MLLELQDLAALGRLHTEKLDELLAAVTEIHSEANPREHHDQTAKQVVYKTDKFVFVPIHSRSSGSTYRDNAPSCNHNFRCFHCFVPTH